VKVASSSVRYLGDWEVKAKSTLGSQVQVSNNYVPVGSGEAVASTSHQGPRPNPEFPMTFYRGRGGPRGRFFRGGPPMPFRGGRGYMRGSYNPNYTAGPSHHYQEGYDDGYQQSEGPYRGRGRGHYHRGMGRGGYHSSEPDLHHDKNIPVITSDGPTIRHNYSYLDELDRAYEKYFSSITRRNDS